MSILNNQPENANFLSPLGFRFIIDKLPNVNYFCQSAGLPAVALTELSTENPFIRLPYAGTKLDYAPFDIRFRVDEDMKNYLEIYEWLTGLGTPEKFDQYKELQADGSRPTSGVSKIGPGLQGVFSDAALVIMTSSQNPNKRVKFTDVYPTNLSPLQFDVTGSDVAYLEADVTFRYRQFTVVNA